MSKREYRRDTMPDVLAATEECPWCGDELRDGQCARHCPASRRMDTAREERLG